MLVVLQDVIFYSLIHLSGFSFLLAEDVECIGIYLRIDIKTGCYRTMQRQGAFMQGNQELVRITV